MEEDSVSKKKKTKTESNRVYVECDTVFGIDMGVNADGSWIKIEKTKEGVHCDRGALDGGIILSKRYARMLGERLIAWSK